MNGRTHARLFGECGLETFVAPAVIGGGGVDAVSVAAGAAGTFVHVCGQRTLSPSPEGCPPPDLATLTDALPPDVLRVAHVTLAAVARGGGQTAAIETQVGEVSADVNGLVQGGCAYDRDDRSTGRWLIPGSESGPCLWVPTPILRLGPRLLRPGSLRSAQSPALDSDPYPG